MKAVIQLKTQAIFTALAIPSKMLEKSDPDRRKLYLDNIDFVAIRGDGLHVQNFHKTSIFVQLGDIKTVIIQPEDYFY